jgi:hypothetical protein
VSGSERDLGCEGSSAVIVGARLEIRNVVGEPRHDVELGWAVPVGQSGCDQRVAREQMHAFLPRGHVVQPDTASTDLTDTPIDFGVPDGADAYAWQMKVVGSIDPGRARSESGRAAPG